MSYYRRGYSWEQIRWLPAPIGGWNPDAPPQELQPNQAQVLDNLLIRPGKVSMRGPFTVGTDNGVGALGMMGYLLLDPRVPVIATRTQVAGNIDPWHAPIAKPSVAAQLTQASGSYLSTANIDFGVLAATVSTRDLVPGPRWINFDGWIYYLGCDSTAAVANSYAGNYVVRPCQLCNTPPNAITLTGFPLVPRGALDLKGYQSRIWLAGGIDVPGGGTTFSPTTIFFSNNITGGTGAGHGGVAADWQDPVSGLTNQIKMDNNFDDPVVGFGLVRNGLVIFRRSSVWMLRGTTSSNYTIVPISREAGCLDARSIVETDAGCYFMSHRGLMLTDGVRVVHMSGTIQYLLLHAIEIAQFGLFQSPGSAYSPHIECALLTDGSILVSMGAHVLGALTVTPIFCAMFSPASRTWTRITSSMWNLDTSSGAGTFGYPGHLMTRAARRQAYTIGDRFVTMLEDPDIGHSFINSVNSNSFSFYDVRQAANQYYAIPAKWTTRAVDLIDNTTLTRKFSQAKRYFVDYVFAYNGGLLVPNAWSVVPVNSQGVAYVGSSLSTPALAGQVQNSPFLGGTAIYLGGFSVPFQSPSRANKDFSAEVDDLWFNITFTDAVETSAPTSGIAELYGVGLEYQPARDLR